MNQKQFEDNIKKTFTSHHVPLDTDALWNAIETDLPAEKKRKPFFFWFFFGMSGLFLIGTIAFFQYDHYSTENTVKSTALVRSVTKNTSTVSTSNPILPIASNIVSTDLSIDASVQKTNSIQSNTQQQSSNLLINERIAKTNLTKNVNPNPSDYRIQENTIPVGIKQISTKSTTGTKPSLIDKKAITEESTPVRFKDLNQLTLKWALLKNTITTKPVAVPTSYTKWRLFATIQGGTTLINKTVKTNNTDFENYITLRNETETPRLSYQFSTLIGVQHQKTNWYIKSGFQYQQVHEVFDYEESNDRILYALTGDNKTERTTRTVQHFNQINILEIPVIVGKSFRNRRQISLELEAGFATSLSLNANGRFINEEMEIENLNTTMFRQHNWSVIAAVGGAYKLSPTTSLTLGVAYQQYINSIKIKDPVSKDQYRLLNVRLGLKKVF